MLNNIKGLTHRNRYLTLAAGAVYVDLFQIGAADDIIIHFILQPADRGAQLRGMGLAVLEDRRVQPGHGR
jgi:hypothetical protein